MRTFPPDVSLPSREVSVFRSPAKAHLGSAITAAAIAVPAAAQFSFAPVINNPLPEGHTPTSLVLRDLDADGKLDAIVTGRNLTDEAVRRTRVTMLRGQGDGRFLPWQELLVPGGTGEWVVAEDFDRDGRLDLAVTISGDVGSIEVFRGTPTGFAPVASLVTEREPRGLAAADFNGDGFLDLANTNYSSSSVTVFLGDSSGGFAPWRSIRVARHSGGIPFPNQVFVGDLDGDGDPDLACTNIGGSRVNVVRNLGGGRFEVPVDWRIPRIPGERPAMTGGKLEDVDLDGDLDVVVGALMLTTQQRVYVFRNQGDATFGPREFMVSSPAGYAWAPALGDLDGDGRKDLALGTALAGFISLNRNESASPSGPLVFPWVPVFLVNATFNRDVQMVDIDGDCDLDLVGIEIAISSVYTFLNETPQANGCGGGGVASAPERTAKVVPSTIPLPAGDAEAAARLLEDFRPGSGAERAAREAAAPKGAKR